MNVRSMARFDKARVWLAELGLVCRRRDTCGYEETNKYVNCEFRRLKT